MTPVGMWVCHSYGCGCAPVSVWVVKVERAGNECRGVAVRLGGCELFVRRGMKG